MTGFLHSLCAAHWSSYILDVIVLVLFVIFAIIGGKKGFINSFFGIVSTIVALFLAITLAKVVLQATNGFFGMQGWLYKTFEGSFAKIDGFNADVSDSGVEAALKTQNVSVVVARLVMKIAGNKESLPAGTTLAHLLGEATSSLAASLIMGVILFIVVKLTMFFMKKILNGLANKISLFKGVNVLLGSAFGVFRVLIIVCIVLAVLTLFPFEGLVSYLSSSLLVGALYQHNILILMLGLFL